MRILICQVCGKAIKNAKEKKKLSGCCSKECLTIKRVEKWRRQGKTVKPASPCKTLYWVIEAKKFYQSREWRELRYSVLRDSGFACKCCGRSPSKDRITLHVDHIIPRSKSIELQLDSSNLQVLCEDCNIGKSNKFEDKF